MPSRRFLGPLARRARRAARPRSRIGTSVEPLSDIYGYDRGTPVDRRYIEDFLAAHAQDIRGRVLDVGDDTHARRFGRELERVDVLNIDAAAPGTTVAGDLETGDGIPREAFDCILLLETLHAIFDVRRAVAAVYDALRPGGVALVSVVGLSPRDHQWEDYWRLTSSSLRRLLAERFGEDAVEVRGYGNVLAASAYLYGAAAEELTPQELAHHDPRYEVTLCARAMRSRTVTSRPPAGFKRSE
jgi:SAM-dependent methyltransferase